MIWWRAAIVACALIAPPAAAEKVLRWAFQIAETGFDPVQVNDVYSAIIFGHIFDAPLTYDYLERPSKGVVGERGVEDVPKDDRRVDIVHLHRIESGLSNLESPPQDLLGRRGRRDQGAGYNRGAPPDHDGLYLTQALADGPHPRGGHPAHFLPV